jgi:predicted nucleic acid-binding protein
MVVLDTNIIIDHLRQVIGTETLLERVARAHAKDSLALSVVSIQELYESKSTKERKKEGDLLATISPLDILPYTYDVAELAGKIARDLHSPIELADAAIAATAIVYGGQLLTLNRKHFTGIPDLIMLKPDK